MLADLPQPLADLRQPIATTALALVVAALAAWGVTWPPATPAARTPAAPQPAVALPAAQDAYPLYRKIADALDTQAVYHANKAFEGYKRTPASALPGECANQAAAHRLRLLALAEGRSRAGVQLPLGPGEAVPAYQFTALGQVAAMSAARDLQVGHPEKAARTAAAVVDMCVKFARARGAGGKVFATFGACGLQALEPLRWQALPAPVRAQLAHELDRALKLAPKVEAIPRGELTALVAAWQDGPYVTTPLYRFRERYGLAPATRAWKYPETGGISAVAPFAAAVPLLEGALVAGDLQNLRRLGEPPGSDDFLRGTSATAVMHPAGYARWVVLHEAVDNVGRGAQTWLAFTKALAELRQQLVRV
jgi:hypothetical protein